MRATEIITELSRISSHFRDNPPTTATDFSHAMSQEIVVDPNASRRLIFDIVEKLKVKYQNTPVGQSPRVFDYFFDEYSYSGASADSDNEILDRVSYLTNDNAEIIKFVTDNLSKIKADIKKFQKVREVARRYNTLKLNKEAHRAGLSLQDYTNLRAEIERYQSKSFQRIDTKYWDALHKLTVIPASLPKVVYRGIFYDGAKIKDKDKFLSKWSPGCKPGARATKATSWSTSKEVAISFMDSQDNIKDHDNGYHVLLKYEIRDPNTVIADLRNWDHSRFYNQQEIILKPDASDYEVVELIPYEKWDKDKISKYRNFISKHTTNYAGGHGSSKANMYADMFGVFNSTIRGNELIEIKKYKEYTVEQFKKEMKIQHFQREPLEQSFNQLLLPAYAFWAHLDSLVFTGAISPTEFNAKFSINLDYSKYGGKTKVALMHSVLGTNDDKEASELARKKIGYSTMLEIPIVVTMTNNNVNLFEFFVEIKNSASVVTRSLGQESTSPNEQEILNMFKPHAKLLIRYIKESFEKENSKILKINVHFDT